MMMGYCDLLRVVERATSQTMSFTEKLAATNLLALKEAALRFRFVPCNLPIVLTALCLCGWLSSTATGQLRSGRTTRSLYVDEAPLRSQGSRPAVVQSSSGQRSSGRNRAGHVVAASYNDSYPDSYSDSYSGVETAPCDSCGDTSFASEVGAEPYYESDGYSECGLLGCYSAGCSSCGGYSELAPTCTSMACVPGRGPLLSLWCRMSVRAEVPLYWRRAMGPPPLVTTSPDGTDADLAGELGRSTTRTLLGGVDKLDDQSRAGLRLTFSTWLGADQRYGLMFRYWNAGTQDDTFNFSSNQFPILARPFLDTSGTASVQNTQLVAFPGDTIGNISVATESKLDGLELTLKRLIYQDRFTRVDWLYGYQHVSIDESLSIFSNTTVTGNVPGLQGNSIAVRDTFRTANDFNGMSYGLMSSRQINCWKLETLVRLGLGNLRRKVNINGTTTTTANGTSQSTTQGLLARNTNDQPFVDDTFVVVPEVGINLACQLRPGLDFTVGYNYMMVPKVAQASQQINDNLAVNLSDPRVGSLDPTLRLNERNYWINSLGLGLQLRY
ncbi:MAG: BBP7 family outer membrane beta-barrel protein [Pirellulaceae bacterium]|jgi:hypothetical protein